MNAPAEKLITDAKVLASDLEELVKATAAQTGERLTAARARVQATLVNAQETVVVRGKEAARATDQYVRQNPWEALGITAGVAVIVGFLIGRR